MITILLQTIINMLQGWIESFNSHAQHMEDKIDSIDSTASDIKTDADNLPDIKDNTAAIITPIQSIKSNTDSISTSSSTTASNTTAILNNIGTLATNTGNAAAYAEDCANNTLNILDKVTTIASDTTQIRSDSDNMVTEQSKIYDAIKWLLADKTIEATDSGHSPLTFDTDIADDLISCKAGIVYSQTGSGDPSPDNIRDISGYSTMTLTLNGSSVSITLGDTYYSGYLDVVSGSLVIDMVKDSISSTYLSGLSSTYFGYVASVPNMSSHPAIWIRNWKTPPACKDRGPGGIKCGCNAFNIKMNDTNIISTQYRIYFDVNNMSISSTSDFITKIQTIESNNDVLEVVYELGAPITVSLTAQQLTAIAGVNTITSDTNGDIEVTYNESIKKYLDKLDNQ